jgi:putative ABC transport system permease protein
MRDPNRWFRRLLRILPADFQADYARDMERTFRAQREEAARLSGVRGVARVWWDTVRDLATTAPREHLDQLRQDITYALRNLRRRPVLTTAAALTLALGIGGVTAILSVVNGVDWRPLGYPRPDEVVFVQEEFQREALDTTGYATFTDWRDRTRSFAALAAMTSMSATLSGTGEPEQLTGLRVTPSFFDVTGVKPALGRGFVDAENRWADRRFVIISDRLWRRHFSADPGIVGRAIQLGGRPHVVTGVMPAGVEDVIADRVFNDADLWAPLGYDLTLPFACRTCRHVRVVGRLRGDLSMQQAEAEMDAVMAQIAREHPTSYATPGARVVRVADHLLGPIRPALYLLLAAVGVLLLIAGVNVANLLLARSVERGAEIATRRALGVATGRLVRQLLTESLVLAALGALGGLVVAYSALQALVAGAPPALPRIAEVSIDGRVLTLTVAVTAAIGLFFGMLPAWQLASTDVVIGLRGSSSRALVGRGSRMGRFLIAANVALAVVLLTITGLLGQSFVRLLRMDPGFEPRGVMTAGLVLSGPAYAEAPAGMIVYDKILTRVVRQGELAAFTSQLPVGERNDSAGFHVDGRVGANPEEAPSADRFAVTPDYFRTLQIPIVRGRAFTSADGIESAPVAILNRAAARQAFGDADPIGQRIMLGGPTGPKRLVVGVVGDVRHRGLGEPVSLQVYIPATQFYGAPMRLVLRTSGGEADAASRIRTAVRDADPTQAVHDIRAFDEIVAATLSERRFLLLLIALFAGAAVLLAVIGLYGVVSYVVSQRTRDIGLRVALGAGAGDVRRLVFGIGMAPVAIGVVGGLALAGAATRPIEGMLFGVDPLDARAPAGAVAVLLVSSVVACWLPARRATRVDPVRALRAE